MDNHQKGWNYFLDLILKIEDKKTLSITLDLFLTREEKSDLSMRYFIIKELLKEEKTQRQMAKDLKVSIAKITRGSNALKCSNTKLIDFLKNKLV